jgi:hypothetical protein
MKYTNMDDFVARLAKVRSDLHATMSQIWVYSIPQYKHGMQLPENLIRLQKAAALLEEAMVSELNEDLKSLEKFDAEAFLKTANTKRR